MQNVSLVDVVLQLTSVVEMTVTEAKTRLWNVTVSTYQYEGEDHRREEAFAQMRYEYYLHQLMHSSHELNY